MSKGGKTTTQTTTPDQMTQDARGDVWRRGQSVLNDPRYQSLMGGFGDAGQAGVDAIASGDYSQFLNPYMDQVIGRITGQFGKQADMASNYVDQRATQAGAFGGSRAELARGKAVGDVANHQADAISQLIYGGWNDAAGRAQGAANLGLGGYQDLAGMPGSLFDDVFAYGGQTQKTTVPGGSMLGGLVGLGTTIAGFAGGGPAGAKIGAAAGSMMGGEGSFGGVQAPAYLTPPGGVQGYNYGNSPLRLR